MPTLPLHIAKVPSQTTPTPPALWWSESRPATRAFLAACPRADGWLSIGPDTVRTWAQAHGVQSYVLIRTLGHLPGCRVTPDGGLMVREEP